MLLLFGDSSYCTLFHLCERYILRHVCVHGVTFPCPFLLLSIIFIFSFYFPSSCWPGQGSGESDVHLCYAGVWAIALETGLAVPRVFFSVGLRDQATGKGRCVGLGIGVGICRFAIHVAFAVFSIVVVVVVVAVAVVLSGGGIHSDPNFFLLRYAQSDHLSRGTFEVSSDGHKHNSPALETMTSQITPNSFLTRTGPSAAASTTVFFISGNPGLISYYHPFLSLLSKYLAKREDNGIEAKQLPALQLYGCSLGGFEINSDASDQLSLSSLPKSDASDPKHRKQPGKAGDYDLEDQIRFVDRKLTVLMETTIAARSHDPRPDSSPGGTATQRPKVILIGHSVGAYIAMEILRRHRETIPKNSSERRAAEPASMNDYSPPEFDIVGGAMLFPTVIDIAASPSGQKFTVRIDGALHLLTWSVDHLADIVLSRLFYRLFPGSPCLLAC